MDKKKHIGYFLLLFSFVLSFCNLAVFSAWAADELSKEDIFFKNTVDNDAPTERTMLIYTSRLYDGVGVVRSVVTPPVMEHAKIYPLFEEPDRKVDTVNGRDYMVLEFRYAIFPEMSGNFVVEPPKFSGTVYGKILQGKPVYRNQKGFLNSNPYRNVKIDAPRKAELSGNPVKLRVMPSFGQHIVGEDIVVNDKWVPADDTIELGQTLNRSISVKLKGANPDILPAINIAQIQDFRVYSNDMTSTVKFDKYGVTAEYSQDSVYIPEKEGEYIIPEIQISWTYNKTGENKTFSIPAKTIKVAPQGSTPAPFYPSFETEEEETDDFFFFALIKKWVKMNDSSGFLESFFISILVSIIVLLFLRMIIRLVNKVMEPPSAAFGEDKRDKAYEAVLNRKRKK
jgi:hypothetical protein